MKHKVLISQEDILAKAKEIGEQITEEFKDEQVVLVGILKGSIPWMVDVMRNIDIDDLQIDFMACSSYGAGTKTTGTVKILKDIEADLTGKVVIIIEDIIDSGITLTYLLKYFENRGAKVVKTCTLLDKPSGRRAEIEGDYVGFEVGDEFIVGYGLDYNQKYRHLPFVSCLD